MSSPRCGDGRVQVASVPATHVYVRRLAHPGVVRLRDPSGDDHRAPCFLDPTWWETTEAIPDLLHIHFGFEHYDPAQLSELAVVLRRRRVPLVYTVHDLRNPNHATPELQNAGLDVLVPAADELVTLTSWAAARILERWDRRATVLPHPHVAEPDRMDDPRPERQDGTYRLGIHFKSLRPNMVRSPLLAAAGEVARSRDDLRLEIHLHCDVVSPGAANHDPDLVTLACDLADEGLVDLHVHPYLSHHDLTELVGRCDGYVLPYRFGTHSGLLELCRDLGTAVIAPACGGYGDQGATHLFASDEDDGFDAKTFRDAVTAAVELGPPPPLSRRNRDTQRQTVAEGYRRVYERALDDLTETAKSPDASRTLGSGTA